MSGNNDLNDLQAGCEPAENICAAPEKADAPARRFVLPWRLNANAGHSLWQQSDDASCGSGPVD